jgi:hypothetical protein
MQHVRKNLAAWRRVLRMREEHSAHLAIYLLDAATPFFGWESNPTVQMPALSKDIAEQPTAPLPALSKDIAEQPTAPLPIKKIVPPVLGIPDKYYVTERKGVKRG